MNLCAVAGDYLVSLALNGDAGMIRILAIGLGLGLGIALLPQGSPRAEAVEKAKVKKAQKSTNDKGIAWVSGDGGVRGYSKAGKGLKARTTKSASFSPSRLQSMLVDSANVQNEKRPKGLKSK